MPCSQNREPGDTTFFDEINELIDDYSVSVGQRRA